MNFLAETNLNIPWQTKEVDVRSWDGGIIYAFGINNITVQTRTADNPLWHISSPVLTVVGAIALPFPFDTEGRGEMPAFYRLDVSTGFVAFTHFAFEGYKEIA